MKRVPQRRMLDFADRRGMTLIEIMITIVIIGGMMALGASYLFPGDEAKMRDEAGRLAGVIKFVYNEAAIKNRHYRLAFDLEGGSYAVESTADPTRLVMVEEGRDKRASPAPVPAENPEASPPAAFTEEAGSYLVAPHKLPGGVKFKDIYVLHEKEPRTEGKVHAYFFPNGWAEKTVVNFSDEDEENFYSIEVNPLTGKSKIRSEYFEMKPDASGAGSAPKS